MSVSRTLGSKLPFLHALIILLCVVASSQCHSILYSVVTLFVWDLHSMVNACVQYPVTQFCFELSPLSTNATMLPSVAFVSSEADH